MDFTLTDEQILLRDTARALFRRECPMSLVRACMDDPAAVAPLEAHLRDWVVLGDGALVDLCLFLEEHGAALAPGTFFVSAALALPLLRAAAGSTGTAVTGGEGGSGAGRDAGVLDDAAGIAALADRVAAGELAMTVAVAGTDGRWVPNDDPRRTFVLEADQAGAVAVVGDGGIQVVAPVPCATPMGYIDFTRHPFALDTRVLDTAATGTLAPEALERWSARASVAVAADLVGTGRALLERTVAYVTERVQFDVPIGSFQAVQHRLADMALGLERATSAVYWAAMCLDEDDPDWRRATHIAKAEAGDAATAAAKGAMQLHGGIGFTWEHDLHLFTRRAYAGEHLLGTAADHRDALADLLFS